MNDKQKAQARAIKSLAEAIESLSVFDGPFAPEISTEEIDTVTMFARLVKSACTISHSYTQSRFASVFKTLNDDDF